MSHYKDETYKNILRKFEDRLNGSLNQDLGAIIAALIELLAHLDELEEKKGQVTFD